MTTSPSHRDEDFNSKWGKNGKTAKMMAGQWCNDHGFYSHTINDDGNWYFSANCSGTIPNDWSRPISDEHAQELGFSNRNDFATDDCKKKGFQGIDSNNWRDKGDWAFSLHCINNQWNDVQTNVKDSKGSNISFQRCDHWVGNDVKTCKDRPPPGTTGWMNCASGSGPRTTSCGNYSTDFNCVGGVQACYAIQGIAPVWDSPVTGCDGASNVLTIQKCNSWVNNDPNSCKSNKPDNIVRWISCDVGSSPGGIAPGDGAKLCDSLSSGPDDFTCSMAKNCFAVTKMDKSKDCGNTFIGNPGGSILDAIIPPGTVDNMMNSITYLSMIPIILSIVIIISIVSSSFAALLNSM